MSFAAKAQLNHLVSKHKGSKLSPRDIEYETVQYGSQFQSVITLYAAGNQQFAGEFGSNKAEAENLAAKQAIGFMQDKLGVTLDAEGRDGKGGTGMNAKDVGVGALAKMAMMAKAMDAGAEALAKTVKMAYGNSSGGKGFGEGGGDSTGTGGGGGKVQTGSVGWHFQKGQRGDACGYVHPAPGPPTLDAPAESSKPASTIKYWMCRHFEKGYCVHGTSCRFAHGEHEIGKPNPGTGEDQRPGNMPTFVPPVSNIGMPQATKKKICAYILRGLSCATGDVCPFSHDNDENDVLKNPISVSMASMSQLEDSMPKRIRPENQPNLQAQEQQPQRFKKTRLCNNFPNGNCPREYCNFAHGEEELGNFQLTPDEIAQMPRRFKKTKVCNHFQNGNCPRGTTCNFAHGDAELGTFQLTPDELRVMRGGQPADTPEQASAARAPGMEVKMCEGYLAGKCTLGFSCTDAHGEYELQAMRTLIDG